MSRCFAVRILLATNNPSKVARVRKQLSGKAVEIVTPHDLGVAPIETEEGSDIVANAAAKARAYLGKVDIPIIGLDTAFVIPGEDLDPAKVRRNALAGRDEATMTREEICSAMLAFYQGIARRHGGTIPAHFEDAFALVLKDGTAKIEKSVRPLVLTDKVRGVVDVHFPMRSLYIVKATGKYPADECDDEEMLELAPYREALERLLGL